MDSTAQVVKRHWDALLARDLDKILEDYSEDAFFITNLAPGAVCGKAMLRGFWTQALAVFTPQVLGELKVIQDTFEREVEFVQWSAGKAIPFGSDTFIVREGKIVAQTATVQMAAMH